MDFDLDPGAAISPTRNLVLSVCDLKQSGVATPSARAGAQMAALETRVYLYGGIDASGEILNDLFLLDVARMEWTLLNAVGDLPPRVFGHTLLAVSDYHLVLFGGVMAGDRSVSSSEAGTGRVESHCLPFMEEVSYRSGALNEGIFVLDTQRLQWRRLTTNNPYPRAFAAVCALPSGAIFVHGGFLSSALSSEAPTSDLAFVLEFNNSPTASTDSQSVLTVETLESGVLPAAAGHGCAYVEGAIYLSIHGTSKVYSVNSNTYAVSQVRTTSGGMAKTMSTRFQSFHALGSRPTLFGGEVYSLMVQDTPGGGSGKYWSKPLYEGGALRVEAPATTLLGDKVVFFGGVREESEVGETTSRRFKFSRKLFFFTILALKEDKNFQGGVSSFKFKIVTVGDSGVGKSCLLTRFINDTYKEEHESTISFDYKTITTMLRGRLCRCQLWDTAGQERFSVIAGSFYRGADAFVLVYDCTDRRSFEHIDAWLNQIQQHQPLTEYGASVGLLLVGNKYDLADQGLVVVAEEEGRAKAKSIGYNCGFLAVSAKSAANVDRAFLSLAADLVDQRKALKAASGPAATSGGSTVRIRAQNANMTRQSANCC